MSNVRQLKHLYKENLCELKLEIKKRNTSERSNGDINSGPGRYVQNIRNCDVFIEDYNFLIYLDVHLYKFKSSRRFDMKSLKNLYLYYNTKENSLLVNLPCLPEDSEEDKPQSKEKSASDKKCTSNLLERPLDLWKLKKITDNCFIKIDSSTELLKPEGSFDFGFASKYRGRIKAFECDLEIVTRMPEPHNVSPLQRSIDREIDEMKNFSRDQYKLNFIELQIPEGHDNPMIFNINFKDSTLTNEEKCLLHNLTSKPEHMKMPDEYNIMEIDCSLISILLGICYDIRFTSNDINCESGWTRSILSATLTYFEPFTSLKDVVISFMRRSLIYPLYRNYKLSKECVKDCIVALQANTPWILKQLLISREIFNTNERSIFNHYYIDDYIRYISNTEICPPSHLQMLAYNLKNILLDIFTKHLGLGLQELETELLKEIMTDIHTDLPYEDDSDDDDYVDEEAEEVEEDEAEDESESCESEFCTSPESSSSTSSSSDTEEDSVIEQKMDNLKL